MIKALTMKGILKRWISALTAFSFAALQLNAPTSWAAVATTLEETHLVQETPASEVSSNSQTVPSAVTTLDFMGNQESPLVLANQEAEIKRDGPTDLQSLASNPVAYPTALPHSITVDEDGGVKINLAGGNPEGKPLLYTILTQPRYGILRKDFTDQTGATYAYVPRINYSGLDSFTYKVNDGIHDSEPATVTIQVNAVNDAPVVRLAATGITDIDKVRPGLQAESGMPLSFYTVIYDPDQDKSALKWELSYRMNGGAEILGKSGEGIPSSQSLVMDTQGMVGSVEWIFRATDGIAKSEFRLNMELLLRALPPVLEGDPINHPPVISPISLSAADIDTQKAGIQIKQGTAITLSSSVNDDDGDAISWMWAYGTPYNASVSRLSAGFGAVKETVLNTSSMTGMYDLILWASDGQQWVKRKIEIEVVKPADAPNIRPISRWSAVRGLEDETIYGQLSAFDQDGDELTFRLISGPAKGSVTVNPDGSYEYIPFQNETGQDRFTFQVNDGKEDSAFVRDVKILLDPVNDAPVALQQVVEVNEDGQLVIVLAGTDVEGDRLIYAVTESAHQGKLVPESGDLTGTRYVYTPMGNFNGTDRFTFKVNDGTVDSEAVAVLITVKAENDEPILAFIKHDAVDQDNERSGLQVDQDTVVRLSASVTDPDGDELAWEWVSLHDGEETVWKSGLGAVQDAVWDTETLSGRYDLILRVSDSEQTVEWKLETEVLAKSLPSLNTKPVATEQIVALAEDGQQVITLAGTDADGNELTYTILSQPQHGTLAPKDEGRWTMDGSSLVSLPSSVGLELVYTPYANANGSDSFTFKVNDGIEDSELATVSINITAVNDAPEAFDIADKTVMEDGNSGAINFTVGDIDNALAELIVSASSSNAGLIDLSGMVVSGTGAGRTLVLTPKANQSGSAVITVSVCDGNLTRTDTFTLTVSAVNDVPTVSAISDQTVNEDSVSSAINFTVGDAETAAGSLTVTGSSSNAALIDAGGIVFGGSGANRTITLTPKANQSGSAVITVNVSDGVNTVSKTFQLTVSAVNDVPTVSAISDQTVNEDSVSSAINFTVGDAETAAGSLTVTASSSNTGLIDAGGIIFGGTGANRTVTLTPKANQSGSAVITVSVSDGVNTVSKTFQLTVSAVNDQPTISVIGNQVVNEDGAASGIAFTIGDVETAAGSLTVSGSSSNAQLLPNGNIVFGGSGANRTVTVTPAANQSGSAVITITVSDGTVQSTRTFNLTVNAVNDAPVATLTALTEVSEDTVKTFTLTGSDVENSALTFVITKQPIKGILTCVAANCTYTPSANQNGADSFSYKVNDGTADSAAVTVNFTITAVNDAPEISDIADVAINMNETSAPLSFTINDVDGPVENLIVSAQSGNHVLIGVEGLIFGGSGKNLTLQLKPKANQTGVAKIDVTVSDGNLIRTESFILTVTSLEVNQPPALTVPSEQVIAAGQKVEFKVGVSDAESDSVVLTAQGIPAGASFDPSTGEFSWMPVSSQIGIHDLKFKLVSGSHTVEKSVRIRVVESYDAASIPYVSRASLADINSSKQGYQIRQGAWLQQIGTVHGSTSRVTSWSWLVQPYGQSEQVLLSGSIPVSLPGMPPTPDASARVELNTSGYAGVMELIFRVTDGLTITERRFQYELISGLPSTAPVLNLPGNQTVDFGKRLEFSVSAADADKDYVTITTGDLPTGAFYNASTKIFSWSPTLDQVGMHSIVFKAFDGAHLVEQAVQIEVCNIDYPPTATIDHYYSMAERDPANGQIPIHNFNDPVARGAVIDVVGEVRDANEDEMTYKWMVRERGKEAVVLSTNSLTGLDHHMMSNTIDTSTLAAGEVEIILVVTAAGKESRASQFLTIVGGPEGEAPVLTLPATVFTAKAGQLFQFTAAAVDPEGETVRFSGEDLPPGASIDSATGLFTWRPTDQQVGDRYMTIVARDLLHKTSRQIVVQVLPSNEAPRFSLVVADAGTDANPFRNGHQVPQGTKVYLQGGGRDPENGPLTSEWILEQAGKPRVVLSSANGDAIHNFEFDTGPYFGEVTFVFRLSDGTSTIEEKMSFEVIAPNPGDPPSIDISGVSGNYVHVKAGSLLRLTVTGEDPDGDTVRLEATRLPEGSVFNAATGIFSWTPARTQAGMVYATFIAYDGFSARTRDLLIIVTDSVSNPPQVAPITVSGAPDANPSLPGYQVKKGDTIQFGTEWQDADSQAVRVTWIFDYSGDRTMSENWFNSNDSGGYSLDTTYYEPGSYTMKVLVYDGVNTVEKTINFEIVTSAAPNYPPAITNYFVYASILDRDSSKPGWQMPKGSTAGMTVEYQDTNGDPVYYRTYLKTPSGEMILQSSGVTPQGQTQGEIFAQLNSSNLALGTYSLIVQISADGITWPSTTGRAQVAAVFEIIA